MIPFQKKIIVEDVASCICTIYRNSKAKVMMVDDIFVEEFARGQGYGTKLMDTVKELAKLYQVDCIELVVKKDNEIAKKLYEKSGYEYSNKEQMRLILNKL